MARGRKKQETNSNNFRLPNGFGSIYKMSGNRRKPFIATKTVSLTYDEATNKAVQKRICLGYFSTREEAIAALSEYNKRPFDISASKQTFEEIYTNWLREKEPYISAGTLAAYKCSYKHCESLYSLVFSLITLKQLQSVVDSVSLGISAKKTIRVLMHQLYEYGMKHDIVQKNYAKYINVGIQEKVLERILFTKEEIQILWNNIDTIPYSDTILILLYSGMRVMELLEMPRSNVDLSERSMYIARAKNKTSVRKVPIHDDIYPLIEKYYNQGADALIPNKKGNFFNYYNYRCYFDNTMKLLDLVSHTPHDARHTFASFADTCELNRLCIKAILGHSSSDITDSIYIHKDFSELYEQINMVKFF